MKKLIEPRLLAFTILIIWSIGCSLVSSFAPEPTPTLFTVPDLVLPNTPTYTENNPSGSSEVSSISDIQSIAFIGKEFELKFKSLDQLVQTYEYYLPNESPSNWFELIEIQYYPVNSAGNQPIDFARRTAEAFTQQYPDMKYSLLTNDNTDEVILDFFLSNINS